MVITNLKTSNKIKSMIKEIESFMFLDSYKHSIEKVTKETFEYLGLDDLELQFEVETYATGVFIKKTYRYINGFKIIDYSEESQLECLNVLREQIAKASMLDLACSIGMHIGRVCFEKEKSQIYSSTNSYCLRVNGISLDNYINLKRIILENKFARHAEAIGLKI